MKNYYCLVHTIGTHSPNPNVDMPLIFETHEEAFNEMCIELSNVTGHPVAKLKESCSKGTKYSAYTCVREDHAYFNDSFLNRNRSWDIFKVQIPVHA